MLIGKILILTLMFVFLTGLVALLVIALVLLPILAPVLFLFERGFAAIRRAYTPFIRWALHNRLSIVAGAVVPFALCWMVLLPRLGNELIPQVHQGEFNVDIGLPVGTPLEVTDETLKLIESRVMDAYDVGAISSTVGVDKTDITSSDQGEHTGIVSVVLEDIETESTQKCNGGLGTGPHHIARTYLGWHQRGKRFGTARRRIDGRFARQALGFAADKSRFFAPRTI